MSTLIKWPTWMPTPLQSGYGGGPVDTRATSDTEAGSLLRKQHNTDEQDITCSIVCDEFQAAFFEAFERDKLAQGTVWFELPIFIGGELRYYKVRFKQRPKITEVKATYTYYGFVVTVYKRELLDKWIVDLLLLFSPAEIYLLYSRLHTVLHIEYPDITELTSVVYGTWIWISENNTQFIPDNP